MCLIPYFSRSCRVFAASVSDGCWSDKFTVEYINSTRTATDEKWLVSDDYISKVNGCGQSAGGGFFFCSREWDRGLCVIFQWRLFQLPLFSLLILLYSGSLCQASEPHTSCPCDVRVVNRRLIGPQRARRPLCSISAITDVLLYEFESMQFLLLYTGGSAEHGHKYILQLIKNKPWYYFIYHVEFVLVRNVFKPGCRSCMCFLIVLIV